MLRAVGTAIKLPRSQQNGEVRGWQHMAVKRYVTIQPDTAPFLGRLLLACFEGWLRSRCVHWQKVAYYSQLSHSLGHIWFMFLLTWAGSPL